MNTKGKKLLTLSMILLAVTTVSISAATTMAAFIARAKVGDNLLIGAKGDNTSIKTIYLNPNIWNTKDPSFYMKRYTNDDGTTLANGVTEDPEWIAKTQTINPTIGGVSYTLHAFQYETDVAKDPNTKLSFYRLDPKKTTSTKSTRYKLQNFNGEDVKYDLYEDPDDPDRFIAKRVPVTDITNDRFKVIDTNYQPSDANNYYKTSTETWTDCGFTLNGDNDIKLSSTGTYTFTFYIHGLDQNDKRKITVANEDKLGTYKWNSSQEFTYATSSDYNYYFPSNSFDWNWLAQRILLKEKVGQDYTWSFKTRAVSFNLNFDTHNQGDMYVIGDFNDWKPVSSYKLSCRNAYNWYSPSNLYLPVGAKFKLAVFRYEEKTYWEADNFNRTVSNNEETYEVTAWGE